MFEKPPKGSKSFHFVIAIKSEDFVIGDLWGHLIENNRIAQVVIRVGANYQGQSYSRENLSVITNFYFEKPELQRLGTKVDTRNQASCRFLEKCGYQQEEDICQDKMANIGCDCYIDGILKTNRVG